MPEAKTPDTETSTSAEGAPASLDYVRPEAEYARVELAEGAQVDAHGPTALTTTVRRGVNMRAWIYLGAGLGVVLAVVLTYAFPEHPDFSRAQVLGFMVVFVTALTTVVVVGIAAIIDAVLGRRAKRIVLTREEGVTAQK